MTFTLPKPTAAVLGHWYRFMGVANQNIVVAAPTADTLVVIDDVEADSLALSTGNQKIGGVIEAICLEVSPGVFKWAAYGIAVGHAYTPAT